MAEGNVKIDVTLEDKDVEKKLDKMGESAEEFGEKVEESSKKTEEAESKYRKLTETIAKQENELKELSGAYVQATVDFGENSKEAKDLEGKISALSAELKSNKTVIEEAEKAAKKASSGLEDLGEGAKEAEKGLDAVDVASGNLVADGLSALLGSLKDMAGEFIALADETREYREDMAKLNAAFKDGGSSTEAAKSVYKDFYQILGESDRSVEAANHLAELTKNEKELSQWGTIAAGVTAKFGDSLPIEGLTEAANETAKVGAVTGPLADALNWAGISEDEFNKKLEKCNSEQERASLITETLNKEYSAAAEEYNKLTASTQNARLATAEMEEAQAAIGEAIEPLTAAWTNMRAQAFEAMLPIVQGIVGAFQSISQWMTENPEKAEIIKAVIIALAAAFGVLAVALGIHNLINLVKTAFASLNVTMLANPIVLIVAALAGLVAAFIYLWNNCEAFRNFWITLWEKISSACSSAWEAIQGWFSSAWEFVTGIWDKAKEFFSGVWDGIKEAFLKVESTLSKFFSDAWAKIKEVFATSTIGQYFALCWQTVKDIFAVVKDVLSGNFSDAWTKIKEVFSSWKDFFIEKCEGLIGVFSDIKDKFFEVGDNILKGIWNGIKAGWDWLIGKVKSLASALFGAAQEELDSHSPSRKFAWLGETAPQGLAVGFEKGMPELEKEVDEDVKKILGQVQATVSAENARYGYSHGAPDSGFTELARAVNVQTAGINSLASAQRGGSMRPVILTLNKRELGRAVVDVSNAETVRVGTKLTGGSTT